MVRNKHLAEHLEPVPDLSHCKLQRRSHNRRDAGLEAVELPGVDSSTTAGHNYLPNMDQA